MNMSNVAGKKVKIIFESSEYLLEKAINQFLAEHNNVWNIQYQHTCSNYGVKFSALIIYDN